MVEGLLLGTAVAVSCTCTWDDADAEPWHDAGRWCVGEAWARVRVGSGRRLDYGYGYGTVGEDGDVVWTGVGHEGVGGPNALMAALGHRHPDRRERRLHGAAYRSATTRWDGLVARMTLELADLLPSEVDVPEREPVDEDEEEHEDEYA